MFIQTEPTPNPDQMKFLPGQQVMPSGTAHFPNVTTSDRSPLAKRLFAVEGVTGVSLDGDSITLSKADDWDWQVLKTFALAAIMNHFTTGEAVVLLEEEKVQTEADLTDPDVDPEVIANIKDLMESHVRPALADTDGEAIYRGFKNGMVIMELRGAARDFRMNIEHMMRHYLHEIEGVVDFDDMTPKPGLDTEEGRAVKKLLDEHINPQVAGHGGHIALVDVADDTVYLRLEGGCQGCGMADVTLKQGVATEIRALVPSIVHVLDVTDHAGGSNPYYQQGKG
ncbi:MAG: NifU family protein [Rhodospirillaceae bacterium]|jgi:Fe-S cluster biogenesis protein NfuA|nr:NifU family protein [Rhodospirillaceae bacterium]MBT5084005.1 NifU family protein [Rhodospirillaceae bacterium]MBT5523915.1 NifU family protein [Rhodospirillaceae bacterium]MBT5882182.1 NifU family protein [Rhodospirillaceae bacterium]MBT6587877.1 NifU family protein [Rhodospirillaceae bacterium]